MVQKGLMEKNIPVYFTVCNS